MGTNRNQLQYFSAVAVAKRLFLTSRKYWILIWLLSFLASGIFTSRELNDFLLLASIVFGLINLAMDINLSLNRDGWK